MLKQLLEKIKAVSTEELDQMFVMTADRNRTSHSYEEEYAKIIAQRCKKHIQFMKHIVERLEKNL